MRQKQVQGFQTGDTVKAVVTVGKKIGTYVGRVAVRASGTRTRVDPRDIPSLVHSHSAG